MNKVDFSLRRHLLVGVITTIGFVGGVGGWAIATNLAGAVVAAGVVVVEGQAKKIQHPTGGVVTSILVKDGMRVKAGDVLLKLDETVLNSNAQIYLKQIDESIMRVARLEAEEKGLDKFTLPPEFAKRADEADIKINFANENALFINRMSSYNSQKTQFLEKIKQSDEEIQGLTAINNSRKNELALVDRELQSVIKLEKQGYALLSRLISLKRDYARTNGDVLNTTSDLTRARSRLVEAQTQFDRLIQETQRDRATEIRDTKSKYNEMQERAIGAKDTLNRAEIRAPYAGLVHQLVVNSVGGVVVPGEAILSIIPENEPLIIEAKVMQSDIDQVHMGESATIKFPAFNARTTPELQGKVIHISADLVKDKEPTGQPQPPFYLARISLDRKEIARLNGAILIPGMAAESYIHTSERSALSYFTKPISDQMSRAFKER